MKKAGAQIIRTFRKLRPYIHAVSAAFAFVFAAANAIPQVIRPALPQPGGTRPGAIIRPGSAPGPAAAVTQPNSSGATPVIPYDDSPNALNFQEASADLVIMEYALRTGLTVVKAPDVPQVNITLRTTPDSPLSDEQYLIAIEQILNLNGIALQRFGGKFLKVVPASSLMSHGNPILFANPETGESTPLKAHGEFVTVPIELKHIEIAEAQSLIQSFVRPTAKITMSERANTIIITDSADAVERIKEIIAFVDKPIIEREEPNFVQIKYAKAADVKARLEEIVSSVQEGQAKPGTAAQERSSGAPGTERRVLPAGVNLRGRNIPQPEPQRPEISESLVADAQRGVIRGKVSIICDERTNKLIIITRPENMVFFNKVIEDLDIATAPEFMVEVFRLEHATAEETATLLNELIGQTKPAENDAAPRRAAGADAPDSPPAAIAPRIAAASTAAPGNRTRVANLDAENIKILPDERTNALVIMASVNDMATIRAIIQEVDIMLSQVSIETMLVDLTFGDTSETGLGWVQKAMLAGKSNNGNGPFMGYSLSGGSVSPVNPLNNTTVESFARPNGFSFMATLFDFNMDVILNAVHTDDRAHLINTPNITTLDNKEAIIESTKRIYYQDGTTYYGNSYDGRETVNIKNEDIGIKLQVTPRINKNGYVTLEIVQEIQDATSSQVINGESLPVVSTRAMSSTVALKSGETIVLGGLASNSKSHNATKVPILGDIPLLGWFFRSTREVDTRNEIVVFLTPKVMDTPASIANYARQRRSGLDTDGTWETAFSHSKLADKPTEKKKREMFEIDASLLAGPEYPMDGILSELNQKYGFASNAVPDGARRGTPFNPVPVNVTESADVERERYMGSAYGDDLPEAPVTAPEQNGAPVADPAAVPDGDDITARLREILGGG